MTKVAGVAADEQIVEQLHLLVRLKPLRRVSLMNLDIDNIDNEP